MQLERITLKLRRRTAAEALDLGQAMLRANAAALYRAWFASFGIAGIVLFAMFWQWPWLAVLLLWWIKPLCDRVMLLSLSRALFGAQLGWRELWRAIPGLLRGPGVISGLTLRRLSLARTFLLPVWQLEQQKGAAARARMKVLARRTRGSAVWLTFVCANMVSVLGLAFLLLVMFMMPVGSDGFFSWDQFIGAEEATVWHAALSHGLWMLAEAVIEPLFVASGFALYLNRRSELEGWDIDVAFRRLDARHAAKANDSTPVRNVAGLAALALCAALLATPPAAEAAPVAAQPSPAKAAINEVLRDPVFGQEVDDMEWRLRPRAEEEKDDPGMPSWWKSVREIVELIARFSRVLVWIVGALLVAVLIYLLIRYREHWLPARRAPAHPPEFLFGLDVRPESLPDDVAAAARSAAAQGRIREALSLLYRATLVALIHRLHIEFRLGDTEEDCLHRVDRRLEAPAFAHFKSLLDHWRAAAYAHQLPSASTCDALCSEWEQHFGKRGTA